LKKVSEWGTKENLMFVVGATKATGLVSIRKIIPDNFLLIPGVGAQGGSLADVSKYGMNKDCGLLVNASRAIIYAGSGEDFADKARSIAQEYQKEMGLMFAR
ncbi:MAG TPA: orotidine 5'-phosphate decarboxylase, partial [Ginsengibacter sp.]